MRVPASLADWGPSSATGGPRMDLEGGRGVDTSAPGGSSGGSHSCGSVALGQARAWPPAWRWQHSCPCSTSALHPCSPGVGATSIRGHQSPPQRPSDHSPQAACTRVLVSSSPQRRCRAWHWAVLEQQEGPTLAICDVLQSTLLTALILKMHKHAPGHQLAAA